MEAALYPTRVTRMHRLPVRHYAEHRSYSWCVDLDHLPTLPRWLRPFARFEATDHLDGRPGDTLRQCVDAFLAGRGLFLPGGRVNALLMPRVLGRAFSPLSLFWCYDAGGMLRAVVAEVQTPDGRRSGHLLPVAGDAPLTVAVDDGYFLVRAPEPGSVLDLTVSQHSGDGTAMVATWRGRRRTANSARVIALQFSTPMAPLAAELSLRYQDLVLRLLGAPAPRRTGTGRPGRTVRPAPAAAWTANWATS